MEGSAVDVSLRLPAEAASPSRGDTATRHDVLPRSGGVLAVSTAAETLTHTAAAEQEPSPTVQMSRHNQQPRSMTRSVPPKERNDIWHSCAEHAAANNEGAMAEQVPKWHLLESTGGAEQTSRARRDAQAASMQRPAPHVLAALPASSNWLSGGLQPLRQPDAAAHGVVTGPPSPTFSVMERAASAAANVAARLFDTDVRLVPPASLC